jgi:uncharacterized protein (TIGR03067 family)
MLLKRLKLRIVLLATFVAGLLGTANGIFSRGAAQAEEQPMAANPDLPMEAETKLPSPFANAELPNQIQGNWILQSVERDGRRLTVEQGSVQLAVTNRFLIWQERGEDRAFTYQLRAENPRALDLTSLVEGEAAGKKILAIYEVCGEELKICESDGAGISGASLVPD